MFNIIRCAGKIDLLQVTNQLAETKLYQMPLSLFIPLILIVLMVHIFSYFDIPNLGNILKIFSSILLAFIAILMLVLSILQNRSLNYMNEQIKKYIVTCAGIEDKYFKITGQRKNFPTLMQEIINLAPQMNCSLAEYIRQITAIQQENQQNGNYGTYPIPLVYDHIMEGCKSSMLITKEDQLLGNLLMCINNLKELKIHENYVLSAKAYMQFLSDTTNKSAIQQQIISLPNDMQKIQQIITMLYGLNQNEAIPLSLLINNRILPLYIAMQKVDNTARFEDQWITITTQILRNVNLNNIDKSLWSNFHRKLSEERQILNIIENFPLTSQLGPYPYDLFLRDFISSASVTTKKLSDSNNYNVNLINQYMQNILDGISILLPQGSSSFNLEEFSTITKNVLTSINNCSIMATMRHSVLGPQQLLPVRFINLGSQLENLSPIMKNISSGLIQISSIMYKPGVTLQLSSDNDRNAFSLWFDATGRNQNTITRALTNRARQSYSTYPINDLYKYLVDHIKL